MTTLVVPWLVFPLVLAALSLGLGLLVEWASGQRLPGSLVLPTGFAAVTVVSLIVTMADATAELAPYAIVATALAGFVVAVHRRRHVRVDVWAVAVAFGVFAVYAAPVVLSGDATFPGYVKLDDDATFLANLDRLMEHGRNIAGLEPSSYLATLQPHLAKGYPMGAVMPIGVGRELVGGDTLWLYHPAVSMTAAMLALTLYALVSGLVAVPWIRALAAFVAAQSALLFGYALWGGLKEIAGAAGIALVAALLWTLPERPSARALVPLAVAFTWLLGVLSSGAALWLLPATVVLVALAATRWPRRGAVDALAGFVLATIVLSLPTIVAAPSFLGNRIFEFDVLANLVRPLHVAQLAGIWPTGDFRFDPPQVGVTYVLVAVAAVAAVACIVWAIERRSYGLPFYALAGLASCLAFFPFVTPWIEGKALAMASPALPLAAVSAAALLVTRGRQTEGVVLAALVAGGVLWSNVLQYRDVWLAPRAQLAELERIGVDFAGDGPALVTEFQPYAVRHLLRKLDAEGASELRVRRIPLRDGQLVPKNGFANLDDFDDAGIDVYRTLVLRRSPLDSRPSSSYDIASRGRWYDVWQRKAAGSRVLEHVPLGDGLQPVAVQSCAEITRLARLAGSDGSVAAPVRPPAVIADVPSSGSGTVAVTVPTAGRYGVWLGGSFRGRLVVSVDGQALPERRHFLGRAGTYLELGALDLAAGEHTVEITLGGADLHPGSGGQSFVGPLVLSTTTQDVPVTVVPSARARELCGKSLDWVEALRG